LNVGANELFSVFFQDLVDLGENVVNVFGELRVR
jgi:hypothetical protein